MELNNIVKVMLDDWLVIYIDSSGHESVRSTEYWSHLWNLDGLPDDGHYTERAKGLVLYEAKRLGAPAHDPEWCSLCASQVQEPLEKMK